VAVFEQKIGCSSLCKKYGRESCLTLFQGNYMLQTFGTIMTFLAMIT